jgi:alkylation response protein AidB-like acyl-CoA dehydrogenase
LLHAGDLHRRGQPCEEAVAMSKLFISEAAVQSGLDAVQLFGGSGMTSETGVDALLRDAIPSRIFSGSSEIQRAIIAKAMGLP